MSSILSTPPIPLQIITRIPEGIKYCHICKTAKFPRRFLFPDQYDEAKQNDRKHMLRSHSCNWTFKLHTVGAATHFYHTDCIDRWMQKFGYCPDCKKMEAPSVYIEVPSVYHKQKQKETHKPIWKTAIKIILVGSIALVGLWALFQNKNYIFD